jgi:hypothetical protein
MKIQTNLRAGRLAANHNVSVARGLAVRTSTKAGRLAANHSRVLLGRTS